MRTEYLKETHEYFIDGERVPSVSELIPRPQFFVSKERLEETRQEGEDNHSMIKMFMDSGNTFDNSMLEAFQKWLKKNNGMTGDIIIYEKPLYSHRHKYAGTPDIISEYSIIDIKRSFGDKKLHALQLAAYHKLAVENKIIPKNKMWLILIYNGKEFKVRDVYNDRAENCFLALVRKYYTEKEIENYFS